jgi:FlaA1/EpsC-like NDP-sugar epimerase/lipopolysaccharide/colanic/teichoic acid biosynthesis glycosyltransferase/glycosyltransferase involved in cell wall biosynthesis
MPETPFEPPFVSVVIPCRNEARHIEAMLASVLAQDYPSHRLEVIVADGLSEDGTRAILEEASRRHPGLHVVDNPALIVPVGMNLGIRRARGEVIVRLDAHSEYPSDYVSRCVRLLLETGAANAGGRGVNVPDGSGPWADAVAFVTSHRLGVGNSAWRTSAKPGRVDTVPFGAFRRDALERVGLYDERLTRGQDHELNARLRAAGFAVVFDPSIEIRYYNQATLAGLALQGFHTAMWNVYILRLRPFTWRWRRFIPAAFVLYLGALACAAAAAPRAAAYCAGPLLLYALLVCVCAAQGRRRGGAARVAATVASYHLCYGAGALVGAANVLTGRWLGQLGRPLKAKGARGLSWYRRRGKRALDFTASLGGLLALSPLLALVAAAMKLLDPGPVFFRQTRAGRDFKPFTIYKFRSMRVGGRGLQITSGRDARVTSLGKLLRKTKLDELPQLFNVLRGDMSLVGPRPTVPKYAEMYRSHYETILSVQPGITDFASIKFRDEEGVLEGYETPEAGYMDDILPEKMALYRRYIEEIGLVTDLTIIFATLLKLAGRPRPPKDAGPPIKIRLLRSLDRRMGMLLLDLASVAAAFVGAHVLDCGFRLPASGLAGLVLQLPYAVLAYLAASYYFGVNRGLRYYASFGDVLDTLKAVCAADLIMAAALRAALGASLPGPVLVLWPMLSLFAVAGLHAMIRAVSHHYRVHVFGDGERKTAVIVGVGDLAELVYQNMRSHAEIDYHVAAFFDDGGGRWGVRLHGARVAGSPAALAAVLGRSRVDQVVVAVPRERRARALQSVADALQSLDVKPEVRVMPSLEETQRSKLPASPRKVQPGDLLRRQVQPLDEARIAAALEGKTILVTGAGGSIGGELCRQALAFKPRKLILLDNNAGGLFARETELRQDAQGAEVLGVLGDVRDLGLLQRIFGQEAPQIVLHAAGHKHIHQLESNIHEGVSNNLLATYHLASAADRAGVETFVLLSTDRAAKPTTVMAATKRAAEEVVLDFAASGKTRFCAVRFGNVLGSAGSVLKVFQEQIEKGKPLTITHPEAARYFMTVEEAAGLILQAAALAKGGEVFSLKMEDQIGILDMARSLVRLSGLDPDRDVQIHFIGLRPGEQGAAEPHDDAGGHAPSEHPGILVVPAAGTRLDGLAQRILNLEQLSWRAGKEAMIRALYELVPAYGHGGSDASNN